MVVHYRSKGLVIGKIDRGEADQIFKIYTRDFGKLSVLGRAVRKTKSKLRGGADFLYFSDIEFIQGRAQKTLTDAGLIESFPGLREDFEKMKVAYSMAEILDKLTGFEEKDERIWKLAKESFLELEKAGKGKAGLLYYYFLWNFFSLLGYLPELYNCSICAKKMAPSFLYFSSLEGGLICRKCFGKARGAFQIDQDLIKTLRVIVGKDWKVVSRLKTAPHLKKSLKEISQDYLDEIIKKLI